MNRQVITEAVARGWCSPKNSAKQMDSDLAEAIIEEVYDADIMPNLGFATTGQLLEELSARAEVGGYADYSTAGTD
jgi:hypothetical protein